MSHLNLSAESIRAAFSILLEAVDAALDTGSSLWDFAIEESILSEAGVSKNQLRQLLAGRLIEHGIESRPGRNQIRNVRPTKSYQIGNRSCFVLTNAGVECARSVCSRTDQPGSTDSHGAASAAHANGKPVPTIPRWDRDLRQLTYSGVLIKRLVRPALLQEPALDKFEAEGWPPQIDAKSFLPKGLHFKTRLHDVISSLNKNRLAKRIRFSSDGSGSGIRWMLDAPAVSDAKRPKKKPIRRAKRKSKS